MALLASGGAAVARSFRYHRPRGVLSAGSEEPNALVTQARGARAAPNTRVTAIELFQGCEAWRQNHVGPLERDALAQNDRVAGLLTAGFTDKTFMWPRAFWERVCEPAIRRVAGLGALSGLPDPDSYGRGYLHPDLLVIDAGAAGPMAALTAGRAGAQVVLADEDFRPGGRLLAEGGEIGGQAATAWVEATLAELPSLPNVRLLTRTTVLGVYDHGIHGAVERAAPGTDGPAQVLWRITARATILAAGAPERPIPFADNDRPGIMLAGAMRAHADRWGVSAQRDLRDPVAILTNNDDGHRTALALVRRGVPLAAVIDMRDGAQGLGGYETLAGAVVSGTRGRLGLTAIEITHRGTSRWLACGALGVAGGWSPNLHLSAHHRARPVRTADLLACVPGPNVPKGLWVAGAANGPGSTAAALADGARAALGLAHTPPSPMPRPSPPPGPRCGMSPASGAPGSISRMT